MKKEKKVIVVDIILIVISLYLALLLKFDFRIKPEYIEFFLLSIIPVVIFTITFNVIFKLYSNIWKYASVEELLSIVYSMTASNIVFIVYGYFIIRITTDNPFFRFPITVHIIFWLLSVVSLGGVRFLYRLLENNGSYKSEVKKKKNLLIIGAGDAGAILIKEIKNNTTFKL